MAGYGWPTWLVLLYGEVHPKYISGAGLLPAAIEDADVIPSRATHCKNLGILHTRHKLACIPTRLLKSIPNYNSIIIKASLSDWNDPTTKVAQIQVQYFQAGIILGQA
jgi:hypothetical protein